MSGLALPGFTRLSGLVGLLVLGACGGDAASASAVSIGSGSDVHVPDASGSHARGSAAARGPEANAPSAATAGRPGEAVQEAPDTVAHAIFAGGCFWCMEPPFDELDGVVATVSGYTGGRVENPTYDQVSAGTTGHVEAVEVVYDPRRIDYGELLDVFWRNVDPTDGGGQFCDRGSQYVSAIFYVDEEQERLARASKRELEESGRPEEPIVTEIRPAEAFYPAEEYHQDYYRKNPIRYRFYRFTCGRDRTLEDVWG